MASPATLSNPAELDAARRSTQKLPSRLYLADATIIVGSDTANNRLPALLMSTQAT